MKACSTTRSPSTTGKPGSGCAGWCENRPERAKCAWRGCSACPTCLAMSSKPSPPATRKPATPSAPHAVTPTKNTAQCTSWCKNNQNEAMCAWRGCSACPSCLAKTPKNTETKSVVRSTSSPATPNECSKCVTLSHGRSSSCCGKGGAWEGKCGSPDNAKSEHTWGEGLKVCSKQWAPLHVLAMTQTSATATIDINTITSNIVMGLMYLMLEFQ